MVAWLCCSGPMAAQYIMAGACGRDFPLHGGWEVCNFSWSSDGIQLESSALRQFQYSAPSLYFSSKIPKQSCVQDQGFLYTGRHRDSVPHAGWLRQRSIASQSVTAKWGRWFGAVALDWLSCSRTGCLVTVEIGIRGKSSLSLVHAAPRYWSIVKYVEKLKLWLI